MAICDVARALARVPVQAHVEAHPAVQLGRALILGRRELALLELLLRRAGRVVAKGALEEGLYGFDEPANPLPQFYLPILQQPRSSQRLEAAT